MCVYAHIYMYGVCCIVCIKLLSSEYLRAHYTVSVGQTRTPRLT